MSLRSVLALVLPLSALLGGVWPVDPPRVLEGFDPPAQSWLAGHRGIDLSAEASTPVRALAAGRVSFAAPIGGKPVVVVSHGGTLRSTYEPVYATVSVGDLVDAGDRIGTVAPVGGHCGGTCLHVGLKDATGYRDPRSLIERPIAVLKPLI